MGWLYAVSGTVSRVFPAPSLGGVESVLVSSIQPTKLLDIVEKSQLVSNPCNPNPTGVGWDFYCIGIKELEERKREASMSVAVVLLVSPMAFLHGSPSSSTCLLYPAKHADGWRGQATLVNAGGWREALSRRVGVGKV